jgi:mono/diheme cytochrome c family protein
MDWLHVTASAAWAGGVMCLGLVVLARARDWPVDVVRAVAERFSRLAGWCLLAVALTGAYNAWVQLPGVSALWATAYGRVLAVKLLLVLGLVWWGAVTRYTIVPRLSAGGAAGAGVRLFRVARLIALGASRVARAAAPGRFCAYMLREALLALAVFGCTAVLADSTPARHAGHARHEGAPEPGPFRVSMDELHRQGGVPRGWMFAPPSGDAGRGRQVFVRLACFACHKVSGEAFPPPSGVGPDLTDVGAHHPGGYILESILNPNAVVVKGAGYTGPDGRSAMPDYRGQLSVSELIDLVAYLKSR